MRPAEHKVCPTERPSLHPSAAVCPLRSAMTLTTLPLQTLSNGGAEWSGAVDGLLKVPKVGPREKLPSGPLHRQSVCD